MAQFMAQFFPDCVIRVQTFTPSYFAWPPRKAGKTDTNFLTCEKNRISLLIGHTIFFTSEIQGYNICTSNDNMMTLFNEASYLLVAQ